jgi:hypothetical protein
MKAHDVLLEHIKQTVTIASATLALTIGFIKDILGPTTRPLRAEWLLEASWGLLGLAILLSIYVLATAINSLDSAGADAPKAFKAGENLSRRLLTLGTFLTFGVGMAFLGAFGVLNFEAVVHRNQDFSIGSASDAINAAKKALPATLTVQRVAVADLIQGTAGSGLPGAEWHVILETCGLQSCLSEPAEPTGAADVRPSHRSTPRARCDRKQSDNGNVEHLKASVVPSGPKRVDYYVDAKTGAVVAEP